MRGKIFAVIASINMFIAVGAGAFGAHGLKSVLSADMLSAWHTGVLYQLIHGLALLAISLFADKIPSRALAWAGWLMVAGVVMFSGSLYALALTQWPVMGPITPIGGLALLLGWLAMAKACYGGATR